MTALTLVVLASTSPAHQVAAREYTWPGSINSLARNITLNKQLISIHYPVLGDTVPGRTPYYGGPSSPGYDDFCFVGTREYLNAQCNNGIGHAGVDIYPVAGVGNGQYPVVAAYAGIVRDTRCSAGEGNRVTIEGYDGRFYHYLHLDYRYMQTQDEAVSAGQIVGFMGDTNTNVPSCRSDGGTTHLHFEIRQGGNNRDIHAIDPYLSLRRSYAWLGRGSDGLSYDSAFKAAWDYAVAPYPETHQRMAFVGWPSETLGGGNANIRNTTSYYGQTGKKQYLANPWNWYSWDYRSAVIIKRDGTSAAFLVPREVYSVYQANSEQSGFLGFPTSHYLVAASVQYFQGGCIGHNGSIFVARPYGTWPC